MSAGGKGGSTSATTTLDPSISAFRDDVFNRARQVGNSPYVNYNNLNADLNPVLQQAQTAQPGIQNAYGSAMGGLGIGMNTLQNAATHGFDPNSASAYFNPYQSNVIDALRQQFGQTRADTSNAIADQATRAGAFGGSRAAIAQGAALGQLGIGENAQIANLQNTGYQNALSQAQNAYGQQLGAAGNLANLGLAGAQGAQGYQGQLGQFGAVNQQIAQDALNRQYQEFLRGQGWNQQNLGLMGSILSGSPYGQTQMQTQRPGSNPFTGALGGFASGMSVGGPIGGAIGGGLGLLGGLFG